MYRLNNGFVKTQYSIHRFMHYNIALLLVFTFKGWNVSEHGRIFEKGTGRVHNDQRLNVNAIPIEEHYDVLNVPIRN